MSQAVMEGKARARREDAFQTEQSGRLGSIHESDYVYRDGAVLMFHVEDVLKRGGGSYRAFVTLFDYILRDNVNGVINDVIFDGMPDVIRCLSRGEMRMRFVQHLLDINVRGIIARDDTEARRVGDAAIVMLRQYWELGMAEVAKRGPLPAQK